MNVNEFIALKNKNVNMENCKVAKEINCQQEDIFDTVFNI